MPAQAFLKRYGRAVSVFTALVDTQLKLGNDFNRHVIAGDQECPVCKCTVPGHKINYHLDMCLKRKEREET